MIMKVPVWWLLGASAVIGGVSVVVLVVSMRSLIPVDGGEGLGAAVGTHQGS